MNNIIHASSKIEFINTVCEIIKKEANRNIDEKGSFTFVLSGGRTPKDIFQNLASNYNDTIDWSKVHFFWVDERCVEATHENSNYKLAFEYLISKLNCVGSVHRIKGELEPDRGAEEYEKEIINFFKNDNIQFDFILLGMGEDGHIASLFPGSREMELPDTLVLATERKNRHRRITLGIDIINISNKVLLVNNKQKRRVLNQIVRKLPCHVLDSNVKIIVKREYCD